MILYRIWKSLQRLSRSCFLNSPYQLKTTAVRSEAARILYVAPDMNTPSWGIGTLYQHVRLLREQGFNAAILHARAPFAVSWFKHQVPILYANDKSLLIGPEDILVVPEIFAFDKRFTSLDCQKIVFAQNSYNLVQKNVPSHHYKDAGYRKGLTVMEHLKKIIEAHHGLDTSLAPYFIAPYFFIPGNKRGEARKKRILLYPKQGETRDYLILKQVLLKALSQIRDETQITWEILELSGQTHEETAALMQNSIFLITVNVYEALNSSVAEAMASGCINYCYDAFGPLDYLQNGTNAFVYPNHHIYPLIEGLLSTLKHYPLDSTQQKLAAVQSHAFKTAQSFSESTTAKSLAAFYRSLGCLPDRNLTP